MYKQGKNKYKSKEDYQRLLIKVMAVFFVCGFFLVVLKEGMNNLVFYPTFLLSVVMIVHLLFRFWRSRGFIKKYIFDEL
jgi:uncharacterized membrane protein YjjP (DUF1212 family)